MIEFSYFSLPLAQVLLQNLLYLVIIDLHAAEPCRCLGTDTVMATGFGTWSSFVRAEVFLDLPEHVIPYGFATLGHLDIAAWVWNWEDE